MRVNHFEILLEAIASARGLEHPDEFIVLHQSRFVD